tara:strand:- start:502 stop:621 length:120 start_codon:yes stop_codon:yes gene_type:complete
MQGGSPSKSALNKKALLSERRAKYSRRDLNPHAPKSTGF